MGLVLGFNTQTIYSADLPTKIRAVAAAGFQAIELWTDEVEAFVHAGNPLSEIRRLLADHGLSCFSAIKIEGWFENDGSLMGVTDDHAAILGACRRRLELSAELGASYLIACPIGVLPTLEFLGQSAQINTFDTCTDFLRRVGDADARMVVDAYHLWRGTGKIDDFARARPDQISLLHINDADPAIDRRAHRDRDRLMPGDGIIGARRFFSIARAIGFSGVVSLGVYNRKLWERDPFEVCREAYAKVVAAIGETEPAPPSAAGDHLATV
jgi:sugar phosphate isomerase/epimerase